MFESSEKKLESTRDAMKKKARESYLAGKNMGKRNIQEMRHKRASSQAVIALTSKNHLDAAFVAAMNEVKIIQRAFPYVNPAELPQNIGHNAPEYYPIKTNESEFYTWIPYRFTEKMYELGWQYQMMGIHEEMASAIGQGIALEVARDLGLNYEFKVLNFLRTDLENATAR